MTKPRKAKPEVQSETAATKGGSIDDSQKAGATSPIAAEPEPALKRSPQTATLVAISIPPDAPKFIVGAVPEAEEGQAVQAAPPSAEAVKPETKIAILVGLLRKPAGATVQAMMAATGWQAHSVRGAMSGAVKKGLGHSVTSEKTEAGRIYRIADEPAA